MSMTEVEAPRRSHAELVGILGALTAFASLSIDMYLPSLKTLTQVFRTDEASVQFTLTTFFLGYALGQAVYGPIADRFGRKPPLYASLTLFSLASVGCALAPSVGWLAAMRVFQALGACAGSVVTRAMVRDLFPPEETRRVYSALMLVMGVAPIVAPTLGGIILVNLGWAAIFWLLAILGMLALAAVHFRLPETHRAEAVQSLHLGRIVTTYVRLLMDRAFMVNALVAGSSLAGIFAYIAGSPFVFMKLYGVPEERYGWIFGINSIGLIAASQINGRLPHAVGPVRVVRAACVAQTLAGAVLVLSAWTGWGGLVGLVVPLFVYLMGMGFIGPNSTALAMAPHPRNAGAASALLGTIHFGLAAMAPLAVGAFEGHGALPMAGVVAACGVFGLVMSRLIPRPDSGAGSALGNGE